MIDHSAWLKEHLLKIYDRNPFVKLLDMRIVEIKQGETVLALPVKAELTNLYQMAHGGALAGLADTAMGVSCASLGKRVVTLDFNINFIRGAECGATVTAAAKIVHNGKSTLVAECDLTDGAGKLTAKVRGTFFVVGEFQPDEN
ncbi:MAG: PaaI family thioesterase [Negativicutes bacterium]|nr:PaaI family thioesterase [Negativicutes bacterium]